MAKGIGRHGELFRELCEPAHLIRSARAASRGKRRKPDVARFLLDAEPECMRLAEELTHGRWLPGAYRTFRIVEPKPRLISAAPFRDRVVHHALVSLLEPHFERRFVAHSYACRVGKGSHAALRRASRLMASRRFVLKADVAKFFPSIDHAILKEEVRRVIADERLLAVLDRVIDGSNPQEPVEEWYPGDDLFTPSERRRGLPIGNLTSQFLANVLLDRLDHEVMDRRGFGGYIRYCDDMLVFADDADRLSRLRTGIQECLAELRLRLHPRKGGVHSTSTEVPFLGFRLRQGEARLLRPSVLRATRRLRRLGRAAHEGRLTAAALQQSIAAWRGHARHATGEGAFRTIVHRSGVEAFVPEFR
jgi:retron-type reverse transcriptase